MRNTFSQSSVADSISGTKSGRILSLTDPTYHAVPVAFCNQGVVWEVCASQVAFLDHSPFELSVVVHKLRFAISERIRAKGKQMGKTLTFHISTAQSGKVTFCTAAKPSRLVRPAH